MEFQSLTPPQYFGSARRTALRQSAIKFRDTILLVPARLSSSAAASLLGIPDLAFAAMTSEGIVECLGDPAVNSPKHYHGPYIIALRGNRDFLDQSVRYSHRFWAHRNSPADHETDPGGGDEKWHKFAVPKVSASPEFVPGLDPVVDIGVVEVLLGFKVHEIRILCREGLLKPIGGTRSKFKHKKFFIGDVLKYYGDAAWLHRAQVAIGEFWWDKNHPS
jgi:hypothetical protein